MKYLSIISIVLLFVGCKGTKKVVNTATVDDIETTRLIENYYENSFDFTTLVARTKVKYQDKKTRQTVTVSIRIEKDKKIWMSASVLGITGAKALITPDKVSFYEKINRTYFDGDFTFLSQYFGVQMNFDQLQRLLIGQTVYDLRKGTYEVDKQESVYKIIPKQQLDILKLFFYMEPQQFLLKKQQVVQPKDKLFMDVDYINHQSVNGKPFPQEIQIKAVDNSKGDQTMINIEYRNIDINVPVRFPFSIPSSYKEVTLDEIR